MDLAALKIYKPDTQVSPGVCIPTDWSLPPSDLSPYTATQSTLLGHLCLLYEDLSCPLSCLADLRYTLRRGFCRRSQQAARRLREASYAAPEGSASALACPFPQGLLLPTHILSQICLDSFDASPIHPLLAQPTSQ